MKDTDYLSYLMGADDIPDDDLEALNIQIVDTEQEARKLQIPQKSLYQYTELIKEKLSNGFWNEIIGNQDIIFIFKFKSGNIKEYKLSSETEVEIDKLCAEFNDELPDENVNVYKWLAENDFYHDFMVKHYLDLINRI